MDRRHCACGRAAEPGKWQCDKCAAPAARFRAITLVALVLALTTGCAENWTYEVKSMHHDPVTGRHYVVCKSEYNETFIQVDVTPEVYNLIKVDTTCPAPMSISPVTTTSKEGQ